MAVYGIEERGEIIVEVADGFEAVFKVNGLDSIFFREDETKHDLSFEFVGCYMHGDLLQSVSYQANEEEMTDFILEWEFEKLKEDQLQDLEI